MKKLSFNRVAIIGVGLIGGSIGLAIKKKRLAKRVVGLCHRQETVKKALRAGVVDEATLDLRRAIKDADLIILATPINSIISFACQIVKYVKHNCILTDVGSSKSKIIASIEPKLPKNIKLVATHPLAGSEKKGIDFASDRIFKDSICIFTPTQKTDKQALLRVKKLWQNLGARIEVWDALEHDSIIAFISHLPHIVAFSLINTIPKEYLQFSGRGLRDATRIAGSDPLVWRDICLSNKDFILDAIIHFESRLGEIKRSLIKKDESKILKFIQDAKIKRGTLSDNK